MRHLLPAHRASEEFDQVLDRSPSVDDDRYVHLRATVAMLRSQPQVLPRADFVADLRSRLMAAAESERSRTPAEVHQLVPRRPSANRRRLGTVAASLVIVGGSAGMAAAASGALPGESLYPVKRAVEQARSAVQLDQAGRGAALLDQAATRLDEVRRLQAGAADSALVDSTLESFRSTAESGSDELFVAYQADGDAAHIKDVRAFTSRQMGGISALAGEAGPRTSDRLIDAADTVADIDQQARVLCAACAPQADVTLPEELTSAAGALTMDNLLVRPAAQAQADITVAAEKMDAGIKQLQAATERQAGQVPTAEQLARAATDARATRKSTVERRVSSTITPDGRLLPTVATGDGTAVKDFLTGLTSTLKPATGTLPKTGTPLDERLGGIAEVLTDDLDENAEELGR